MKDRRKAPSAHDWFVIIVVYSAFEHVWVVSARVVVVQSSEVFENSKILVRRRRPMACWGMTSRTF
jgi:hypothetical protein